MKIRHLMLLLPVAVILFAWSAITHFQTVSADPVNGRLPDHVKPIRTFLQLKIIPEQDEFVGVIKIDIKTSKRIDALTLNAQHLNFQDIYLLTQDAQRVDVTVREGHEPGFIILQFDRSIHEQDFALHATYTGQYAKNSEGLWRQNVNRDWYVFNQFNSIFARRAIPGFDEPGIRSPLELEIITPNWHQAISNAPAVETVAMEGGLKRIRFAPTPPISMHQINISVGPFDIIPGGFIKPNAFRKHTLPLRAVTLKGQSAGARFALQNMGKLIEEAEAYFGMPFPFQKLDVIAVPNATEGVLEHPGAINLRDRIFLFNTSEDKNAEKAFLSYFTHALIHHWVGNLVAMDWWSDVWLYEGLSEWLTYRLLEKIYPSAEFEVERQISKNVAMMDDLQIPKALRPASVVSTADINSVYDNNTTTKSAALIRMLERFVQEDKFQSRLRVFFARHAYDLADQDDLLNAVIDSIGQPILAEHFSQFVTKAGVPSIHFRSECHSQRLKLFLTQSQGDETNSYWPVPVCIVGVSGIKTPQCAMSFAHETEWQTIFSCREAFIPNADAAGYYRWTLSHSLWETLNQNLSNLNTVDAIEVANNLSYNFNRASIPLSLYVEGSNALSRHSSPYPEEQLLNDKRFVFYHAQTQEHPSTAQLFDIKHANTHRASKAYLLFDERRKEYRAQELKKIPSVLNLFEEKDINDELHLALWMEAAPVQLDQLARFFCNESTGNKRNKVIAALHLVSDTHVQPELLPLLHHTCVGNNEQWSLMTAWLKSPRSQTETLSYVFEHFTEILASQPAFRVAELPLTMSHVCHNDTWTSIAKQLANKLPEESFNITIIETAAMRVQQCIDLKAAFVTKDKPQ